MEDGGETAFPVADMKDFNETVSIVDLDLRTLVFHETRQALFFVRQELDILLCQVAPPIRGVNMANTTVH